MLAALRDEPVPDWRTPTVHPDSAWIFERKFDGMRCLDELTSRGMHADRFSMRDVPKRLRGQRDPWADMYQDARSQNGPINRLAKLLARTA